MPQDLFIKKTAKDRLYDFPKAKGHAKTSEILYWGATAGYSNRAGRNARILAEEGKIRRMPGGRKDLEYPGIREEVWEII